MFLLKEKEKKGFHLLPQHVFSILTKYAFTYMCMHTYLRLSENQYIHIYYKKYLYYAINKKKIVRVSLTNVSQLQKNCILNQWCT